MEVIDGSIQVSYINEQGITVNTQNGLMMSCYDQTVIFTPLNINKSHFSHLKNAVCIIDDKVYELKESRLAHPFLIRIWNIKYTGINPVSELTINFPKKNHYIKDQKIDMVNDIYINMWHVILPSIFAHEINIIVELGSVLHYNNKVSGMVVTHFQDKSIIISTYTLKQLINGQDYFYANIYYGLSLNQKNNIYVKEDWEQYENSLVKDDIILEIENVPIVVVEDENKRKKVTLYSDKYNKYVYIDTWITCMYLEKDKDNLQCKIIRNNTEMSVNIPRKPLSIIMQIPYYSNDEDGISFEKISTQSTVERYIKIGQDLKMNPKKLFV